MRGDCGAPGQKGAAALGAQQPRGKKNNGCGIISDTIRSLTLPLGASRYAAEKKALPTNVEGRGVACETFARIGGHESLVSPEANIVVDRPACGCGPLDGDRICTVLQQYVLQFVVFPLLHRRIAVDAWPYAAVCTH